MKPVVYRQPLQGLNHDSDDGTEYCRKRQPGNTSRYKTFKLSRARGKTPVDWKNMG